MRLRILLIAGVLPVSYLLAVRCSPAPRGPQPMAAADTLVSYEDFATLQVEGFAPYYRDTRRGALAIESPKYPDRFAAAETAWRGPPGRYDLTLVTLTERDGESTYRLYVGDRMVGEFQNPPGRDDELASRTWEGLELRAGDTIRVASNSHSNLKEREGEGFATSRGRWRYLIVEPS